MIPLVEIFCFIDDFCKYFEKLAAGTRLSNPKRKRNRRFRMSLSEIMTILVLFHLSHYRTLKDFYLDYVLYHLKSYFPGLVSYTRFVELMKQAVMPLGILLNCCKGKKTGIYYIDSTKLQVCNNLRISRNQVFKGIARRGKTSTGWFFGFKLHLVLNDQGEIMSFLLTSGNRDDRAVVEKLTQALQGLLIGDRGYIGKALKKSLEKRGLELITHVRKGMKKQILPPLKQWLLSTRNIIETVIGQLKECCHIQHTRHRSPDNFLANLFAGLFAYVLKPNKVNVSWKNRIHQLPLISN